MNLLTPFIVLIERRPLKRLFGRLIAVATAFALVGAPPAFAAPGNGQAKKIARDLQAALDAVTTPNVKWAREVNGARHLQVVIVSNSADGDMTSLRDDIKGNGGSVHVTMPGLRAVTATLPAAQLAKIAARSDVFMVAPNRATSRTASSLEYMTGALTTGVRTNSTKTSYSGVDGTGIGIAVLDSGVMKVHEAFNNASGSTRVQRNVWMLSTTAANWTTGTNATTSLQPGSSALTNYENAIANDSYNFQDGYGHGTHVASIAAGRPVSYQTAPT